MTAPEPAPNEPPVVLITGASSGIGHALARRFAARGWRVWASMRTPTKGDSLRLEARERGWKVWTPSLDVTDDASVEAAVAELLRETGGRIDLLINNAGYFSYGALEDVRPDELRAQFETNVIGAHRVTRAVLPAMRARQGGRIVFIGSLSGRVALPMMAPYHASKWALEALVESLRYELLAFGIPVVLIEPGPFETALHANEVIATAATAATSPYAELMAAYRKQATGLRRASLPALIDTIERAATVPRPRLRWPVGPTAFQVVYLRRLVPDWIFERVVRFAFRIRAR
ncbi:MAG TPA: SDR family oxidoreductase [Polyangia bacterium]|jgi:NAD(P)-dependent dehydrogenase (short-subunit alcohol dehydrogenase family)|nr:SDR family oxidoreductase [Polyangia bacterium]